jgi:hypothetical protein
MYQRRYFRSKVCIHTGNEALKAALLQKARWRCCEYNVGFEKYTHDAQMLKNKLVNLKERVMRKLAALSKLQAVVSKDKDTADKDARVHNVRPVVLFPCVCLSARFVVRMWNLCAYVGVWDRDVFLRVLDVRVNVFMCT